MYFGSSDLDLYRLMMSICTGFFIVAAIAARTLSWLTCEKSLCSLWIMMHLLGSKAGSVGLGGRLAGGGCCCGGGCC